MNEHNTRDHIRAINEAIEKGGDVAINLLTAYDFLERGPQREMVRELAARVAGNLVDAATKERKTG